MWIRLLSINTRILTASSTRMPFLSAADNFILSNMPCTSSIAATSTEPPRRTRVYCPTRKGSERDKARLAILVGLLKEIRKRGLNGTGMVDTRSRDKETNERERERERERDQ
jgi:hypothetical protein